MTATPAELPAERTEAAAVEEPPPPARIERRLIDLSALRPRESLASRASFVAVAIALTVIYFAMLHGFWAPASPMIDQNAYEMGGRRFAESFTTGIKPANDFVYVSAMYVRAAGETYFPKYPLGMSILYACALWLGQRAGVRDGGVAWAFLLGPLSAAASTLGLFLFLRRLASGFASILGALLLSFSPLALVLVNQHWSHHPAMAAAIWGMLFLLAWWERGGWWRGLVAGLFLGLAVLVRYTEGLLVLPLAFVVLNRLPYRPRAETPWRIAIAWAVLGALALGASLWLGADHRALVWLIAIASAALFVVAALWLSRAGRSTITPGRAVTIVAAVLLVALAVLGSPALPVPHVANALAVAALKAMLLVAAALTFTVRWAAWRELVRVAWPILGWLVPVVYLVAFNKLKMGSWTGYDATNESTGFTFQQLADNWEYIVKQLNVTVIFFYLPVAILGLGMVFRRNWRIGALLTLWLVPNLVTYGCYYWGVNLPAMVVPVLFYFRFFLTCLPPLAACAALLIDDLLRRDRHPIDEIDANRNRRRWQAIASASSFVLVGLAVRAIAAEPRADVAFLAGALAAIVVAAVFEAGRGVSGPIAAGAVVAFAAGVSLYDNRGALDRDFVINLNLYNVGQNVTGVIPPADMARRPLLFTDDFAPVNHLQFAGNFECYTRDVFRRQSFRRSGRSDPTAPDPEQNARLQHMAELYRDKSDADLRTMQNDIMAAALKEGRRVFVVLPANSMADFVRTFVSPEQFRVKATWKWRDPAEMNDEGRRAMVNFGLIGTLMMGRGTPQNWAMTEVALK